MILDSMKIRGFYAFFNGMKFSGTLGLYLVALFMCLGFEVKGQNPDYGQSEGNQNVITVNLTQDFVNASSFTLDNQDLRRQLTENAASKEFYIFNVSQNNNGWWYLNSFGLSLYTSENTLFTNFTNLGGSPSLTVSNGKITNIQQSNNDLYIYC